MSVSNVAPNPAMSIVRQEEISKMEHIVLFKNMLWKRISKKTPAVTNVDEWTRADTGVGAAIAAGSQAEKGICALFVMAAIIIITIIIREKFVLFKIRISHVPVEDSKAILTRISTSPIRLDKTVSIPAL